MLIGRLKEAYVNRKKDLSKPDAIYCFVLGYFFHLVILCIFIINLTMTGDFPEYSLEFAVIEIFRP